MTLICVKIHWVVTKVTLVLPFYEATYILEILKFAANRQELASRHVGVQQRHAAEAADGV